MNKFTIEEKELLRNAGFKHTWEKGCFIRQSFGYFQIITKKGKILTWKNDAVKAFANPDVKVVIKAANFKLN